MKLNAAWHAQHRMPRSPTREQRIAWHAEHSLACQCREVPEGLRSEVQREIERRQRAPSTNAPTEPG